MAYRYDSIQRFLVVVEQLDVATELVMAETVAKARLALIATDNLAELMLVRHAERVFESSEGSHWMKRKRYSAADRAKIRRDFNQKVALALQPAEGPSWRSVEPIVSSGDAAVIRVAHRYRNGVYHEDRHNETLLPAITALYLQGVGRMFVAGFTPGTAVGGGGVSERVAPLSKWGYELPEGDKNRESFEFYAAAKVVVDQICGPLTIALPDLASVLSKDLVDRGRRAGRVLTALREDGMPEDRLRFSIFWSQFWGQHGADEFALELEDERRKLTERLRSCDDRRRDALETDLAATEAAYIGRWHELQEAFVPSATPELIDDLMPAASKLAKARNFTSLLERFERMDAELLALEDALEHAVYAWEELVNQAVDASRGK